jgi:hypothetical protein
MAALEAMSKALHEVGLNELWRGELALELAQYQAVQAQMNTKSSVERQKLTRRRDFNQASPHHSS